MENANLNYNIKTNLCFIIQDVGETLDKNKIWNNYAEKFLNELHKKNLHITVIGPKPIHKFGNKQNTCFLERYQVVGMKELLVTKEQKLEFKLLGKKNGAWSRVRSDACVIWGRHGRLPRLFSGWNTPGIYFIDAWYRLVDEFSIPVNSAIAFLGSTNQVFRAALKAIKLGAQDVFIIEEGKNLKCWNAYYEKFIALGGRVYLNHQILSVGQNKQNQLKELYLKNSIGTLVLEVGALVLFYENELALNESVYWQKGKFYIQRRTPFFDDFIDEEKVLEKLDWIELQARVGRFLGVINQKQFLAKIEEVKNERKKIFSYRDKQNDNKSVFQYNGKVLSKESFIELQEAIYTPSTFISNKPVASLECAQKLPCFECVENCPEGAIEKNSIVNYPKLNVEKCTGCGACVAACPAQAAVMVQELSKEQKAIYFLPERYKKCDSKNSNFYLLNRKGEKLGQGKFIQQTYFKNKPNSIVEIEGSHIYAWDARNYKQEKIIIYDEDFLSQKINHKVGWIAINGVKRLVQLEVPLTIVLNRIGLKRFEDSKFCFDFSCRLCKVKVNGKIELACRLIVKEGMQIEIELNNDKKNNEQNSTDTYLCYCKKITKKTIEDAQKDGASIESICYNLGYGEGTCLGRYCLSSVSSVLEKNFETDSLKIRPYFFGFDKTPWFELWNNDVLITKKEIKRN